MRDDPETRRLVEAREQDVPWKQWGPYLSERQWGTVREDYSSDGSAWDYFTHDQSRSRAYGWARMASPVSRTTSSACASRSLWNGVDPILKERLSSGSPTARAITART
jgi:hypothetical protein